MEILQEYGFQVKTEGYEPGRCVIESKRTKARYIVDNIPTEDDIKLIKVSDDAKPAVQNIR